MNQRNLVPGLILIGLGVFLFVVQMTGVGAEAIVAVIGAGFLVAYAATRAYGFLVPGGIMTGLGLGIIWEVQYGGGGGAVLIGLGLGFLSIYLVDAAARRTPAGWWPLIPGGILATIGVLVEAGREGLLADISRLWPIILIVIGAWLVFVQVRGREAAPPEEPAQSAVRPPGESREPEGQHL